VFEAVEIDGNGYPNGSPTSPVVLKDIWVDSDRTREGNIVALLHAAANDEDKELVEKHFLTTICHGDVWTELDILDDTANALMRGLNITPSRDSVFGLQRTPFIQNCIPYFVSESRLRYRHKTQYRIVLKENHNRSHPEPPRCYDSSH
jgi:hypothetical protein